MNLEMKKAPDKDAIQITVTSEPIKILSIGDDYVYCEWEGTRQKLKLSQVLAAAILSDDIDDAMRGRFVERLNNLERSQNERS